MTALADLITPRTPDQLRTDLLALLAAAGFPTTSWQSGSVPRTLVEAHAEVLGDLHSVVASIAKGGLLDEAEGAWLTLLAAQRYGVTRNAAVATVGTVRLTAAAAAGPYVITAAQLTVQSTSGKLFRNTTGGTLTQGGTLDLTFQAESPGVAWNVASNSITTLVTSLAGVTVNNPASPWTTTSGTDEESDAELRTRCRDKLPALGTGATAAVYRTWAQDASAQVTSVSVVANGATGDVDVYVAGGSGVLAPEVVAVVQAYIDERVPLCVQANVASVTNVTIVIAGTLYVRAAYAAAAEAAAASALEAFARSVAIGGDPLGGGATGVARNAIIEQLMGVEGAVNLTLTTPAGDTTLAAGEVPEFDLAALAVVSV